jgi:hypothetical protein
MLPSPIRSRQAELSSSRIVLITLTDQMRAYLGENGFGWMAMYVQFLHCCMNRASIMLIVLAADSVQA